MFNKNQMKFSGAIKMSVMMSVNEKTIVRDIGKAARV